MKKNIGYVTLNPSTARWLQNNLPEGELRQGIRDLLSQACSTLMVELEDTETPFPVCIAGHFGSMKNRAGWCGMV